VVLDHAWVSFVSFSVHDCTSRKTHLPIRSFRWICIGVCERFCRNCILWTFDPCLFVEHAEIREIASSKTVRRYIYIYLAEKNIYANSREKRRATLVDGYLYSWKDPQLVYVNPGTLPEKRASSVYHFFPKNLTFLNQYLPFTREHASSCSRAPRC
jgi:hypothetical protein